MGTDSWFHIQMEWSGLHKQADKVTYGLPKNWIWRE